MATEDPGVPIEVDEEGESSSSEYGSGSEYSTETLASSAYNYRYENGRRYHAEDYGNYSMPNDEAEQDRLDIMHHAYLLLCNNKLHLAPIGKNPQRILDIGTGTGIWAMDMAEQYPSAQVIGTDLSPIQPSWVPPNVEFQIDDAEQEWTWAADTFDYIHIRHLTGPISNWSRLLEQAFRCVKPGGYVEIQEYDMNLFSDDHSYDNAYWIKKFYIIVHEAAKKSGQDYAVVSTLAAKLEKAGFEDLHYQMMKIPLGTWPADPKQKELGGFLLMNAQTAYDAVGRLLMASVGMEQKDINDIVEGCVRESKSRKIHSYSKQHMFYARKPLCD